jgi:glutathione S-transferase
MIELFQTEWCPASRRVRQRLTELGLDYVNRQVPVERETRTVLRELTGTETIPALRLANGSAVVGEENILVYLSEHVTEPPEAEAHRHKALLSAAYRCLGMKSGFFALRRAPFPDAVRSGLGDSGGVGFRGGA